MKSLDERIRASIAALRDLELQTDAAERRMLPLKDTVLVTVMTSKGRRRRRVQFQRVPGGAVLKFDADGAYAASAIEIEGPPFWTKEDFPEPLHMINGDSITFTLKLPMEA